MNALTIALVFVIITFMVFAIALCLIIARSDRRAELLQEIRDEEMRRTWKAND